MSTLFFNDTFTNTYIPLSDTLRCNVFLHISLLLYSVNLQQMSFLDVLSPTISDFTISFNYFSIDITFDMFVL